MNQNKIVFFAMALVFVLMSTACTMLKPGFRFEIVYSFPNEEATSYICCSQAPPPEAELVFNTVGTPYGDILGSDDSAAYDMSLNSSDVALAFDTACVRLDSLTSLERIRLEGIPLGQGQSCNTFAIFEHSICTCQTTCMDAAWSCTCPGVPSGTLPQSASQDFPQDSIRSRPELLSEACIPCNSQSICSN